MRVLVLGYGSAGVRHADLLRRMSQDVVVSDTDDDRLRRARDDGHEATESFARNVQAVIIATPASTHRAVAEALREQDYAGPLFVEKPLDVGLEDAEVWRTWPHPAACVGYNWRFVAKVGPWAERVSLVRFACLTDMSSWPGGARDGRPLLECSHDFDLARSFVAEGREAPELLRAERNGDTWDIAVLYGAAVAQFVICTDSSYALRAMGALDPAGIEVSGYRVEPDSAQGMRAMEVSYHSQMKAFLAAAKRGRAVRGAASFVDGMEAVRIAVEAEDMAGEEMEMVVQ